MKIKLEPKNADKIEAALAKVNGEATSLTINYASELGVIAEMADKRLEPLPKTRRVGAVVTYTPEGPSASRYKYKAISTRVEIKRFASGWFLTDVARTHVWPKEKEFISIGLTKDQIEEIQSRSVRDFYTIQEKEMPL